MLAMADLSVVGMVLSGYCQIELVTDRMVQ